MPICGFCERRVTELISRSHVIPEWAYKPIYNEKGRALALTGTGCDPEVCQNGYYGKYLCSSCEVQFGKYDRYAANTLRDKANVTIARGEYHSLGSYTIWKGLDLVALQKFVISVVLRTDLEWRSNKEKAKRFIPKEDFNAYRTAYLDPNYASNINFLVLQFHSADRIHESVTPPTIVERGFIRFAAAGFCFSITLDSKKFQTPCEDGLLYVPDYDYCNSAMFKDQLHMASLVPQEWKEKNKTKLFPKVT